MHFNNELTTDLKEVLTGINLIPTLSMMIRTEIGEEISEDTLNSLMNGNFEQELSEVQQFKFLNSIYNITKDERFNPVVLLDSSQDLDNDEEWFEDDYHVVNGEIKKKSKDLIPRFYYQYDFKRKFSKTYPQSTARVVMALFRNTEPLEKLFGKDLYDFNYDELAQVLKSFKSTTIRSLQNQISTIERYIDFARKHKKTKFEQVNYAKEFDSKSKIENLLDKDAEQNMIFDQDELMTMAMYSDNAQDGVILGLLFDGVSHKNEFEELINLTSEDVDLDNFVITIKSNDGERIIPISHETAILIKGALDQEVKYISVNGETSRQYKIAEGDHVLRGLRGKDKVKPQIISQRILRIAEHNDYDYLNATSISYSGQLHYAKQLINDNTSLEDTIDKVLSRFGIPINSSSQFYLKGRIERYLQMQK